MLLILTRGVHKLQNGWSIYLGFSKVVKHALACLVYLFRVQWGCFENAWHVFACLQLTHQQLQAGSSFLQALSKVSQEFFKGFVYLINTQQGCPQAPKWLVYLSRVQQGGQPCFCLPGVSFQGLVGVLQKCLACVCQFAADPPIVPSWLFFLASTQQGQPRALQGLVYLINTYQGCPQAPKWLVYLSRVQQGGQTCSCMLGVSFQGSVGCAPKMYWHVPLLVVNRVANNFKAGFSILLQALSKINQELCKGWCILLGTYQGVSTNSKMAGVSMLGFSKLVQHALACLSVSFQDLVGCASKIIGMCLCQFVNRVANNFKAGFSILLALSKINQELCKGLVYLIRYVLGCVHKLQNGWCIYVRVQQVGPTMLLHVWCIFLGFSRVCSKNVLACAFASSQLSC